MKIGEKIYLGDGVYAEYDGYHLVLIANSPRTDVIYLDDHVQRELRELLEKLAKGK